MFRVAVTDYTFPDLTIEQTILEAAGCQLVSGQCTTPDALMPLVADADAVITQFAPVNQQVVAAMQRARVIVRYGIGFDNVACEAARKKNIPVCNIPDYCIDEVADHTVAFMLASTRRLRGNCEHMIRGHWGLGVPLDQMRTLTDQTVGIIGLGRIGKAVAERLKAFRCRLLAFDPAVSDEAAQAHGCLSVDLARLLAKSDVVTLHCPSSEQTRGLINRQSLRQTKPGAILINVGRGDLVELEALTEALRSGHLAAAALDVFETEPLDGSSPLLKMENVIVTAHIASASSNAVQTLRETAARLAVAALRGAELPGIVNGVTVSGPQQRA